MAVVPEIGVGIFVSLSWLVGVRLIRSSLHAHPLPALSIGLTAILSGGIGFPLLVATFAHPTALGAALPLARGAGLAFVNLGAIALFVFTWQTFRSKEAWGAALVTVAAVTLGGAFLSSAFTSGFASGVHVDAIFWIGFGVRALAPSWAALESLRYYRLMRRRLRIGLAEPLLVNRFLLWGLGSLAVSAMSGTSGLTILVMQTAEPSLLVPLRVGGALLGVSSLVAMWLAFFPPVAYRRRFQALDVSGGNKAPS